MARRFLVTGGAGFIGSAVVRHIIETTDDAVLVVDKLTYAGNLDSLAPVAGNARYRFLRADIADAAALREAFGRFEPDIVMHLAAETHVDRSIDRPADFIATNIVGAYTLLEATLDYWRSLSEPRRRAFRFHHVSTDEVFGSLGPDGLFSETTAYSPNSPYAASKASSDHLVRAWRETFGLPVVLSNCSNNFGPCQFPEKLIPLMIVNALQGEPLPIYGAGLNVRDWLYVEDHARALVAVATRAEPGSSYCVGGGSEMANIDVVRAICRLLDELAPDAAIGRRDALIAFVADRPGHDLRYAIDASKIAADLGWRPRETFDTGLRKTVLWYLQNRTWRERIRSGAYRGERLGVLA